eukprot:scaffold929_cov387-Prasinococcus_capsulatus_cf.AAC.9
MAWRPRRGCVLLLAWSDSWSAAPGPLARACGATCTAPLRAARCGEAVATKEQRISARGAGCTARSRCLAGARWEGEWPLPAQVAVLSRSRSPSASDWDCVPLPERCTLKEGGGTLQTHRTHTPVALTY